MSPVLFLLIASVAALTLGACAMSKPETVLTIGLPSRLFAEGSRASISGRALLPSMTRFRVTVSGALLAEPLVSELAASASPASARVALPGLGSYEISVDALDAQSIVAGRGTATVDAVEGDNKVTVTLKLMPKIYVTNYADNTVSVINGVEESLRSTISVGISPAAIAANRVTRKVYLAYSNQDVTVIDGSSDTVSSTIAYAGSDYPSLGVDETSNKIYAAWQYDNSVQIISGASDSIIANYSCQNYPTSIVVNLANDTVNILDWGVSNIQLLNRLTNTFVTTIDPVGLGFNERCGITVNSKTNRVYALTLEGIYVIDGITNTVLTTIAIGGIGSVGAGVAVNTLTNRIYATNSLDGTVSVIDGQTNTVVATINVGLTPFGIAVSENLNKVYVLNSGAGNSTLKVIDGATNTLTNTISVGIDPQGIAVLE